MATHRYSDGYRARTDVDTARVIAFDVLSQVEVDGAFANIALAKALRAARTSSHVDARDAAFVSELVNGTLRSQGRLDWVIARHLTRPLAEVDPLVKVLLRMGAHQLLDMRVPDHAAVATSVDLAHHHLTDGPTRMVNAVLRAIIREGAGAINMAIAQLEPESLRRAVETSHPEWMVDAFMNALAAHGYPTSEIDDLLRGDNEPPVVTLVARPGLVDPAELADEAEDILRTRVAPGIVSEYAVLIESGDPSKLVSIRETRAGVQDEGSQLAALIAAHAPIDGPDGLWLDLCAGPGGKASLLAASGIQREARLIANELHPHRARLVEKACSALDNVDVVSADGRSFGGSNTPWPLGSFDRIVVDAPCSGMGSLRRRPESRWRRSTEDLDELTGLQRGLLDRALDLVRPGGILTYITCSPHVAETIDQVRRLLDGGGVELFDTVGIADTLTPDPLDVPAGAGRIGGHGGRTLQLWEHRNGTDLMFIAAMRRL